MRRVSAARWEKTHRRYTNYINARGGWTGHLFQRRFASVVMDEAHLIAALRYVSLNPVRAKLVPRARDWPWSSVRAHLAKRDDGLVTVEPVLARVGDFPALLDRQTTDDDAFAAIRRAEGSGRPLATAEFVKGLERLLGRPIARRAPARRNESGPSARTICHSGFRYRVDELKFSQKIRRRAPVLKAKLR